MLCSLLKFLRFPIIAFIHSTFELWSLLISLVIIPHFFIFIYHGFLCEYSNYLFEWRKKNCNLSFLLKENSSWLWRIHCSFVCSGCGICLVIYPYHLSRCCLSRHLPYCFCSVYLLILVNIIYIFYHHAIVYCSALLKF